MWRKALSLAARGARYHMGIAMALITVIPALAISYLVFIELRSGEQILLRRPIVAGVLLVSVVLGYALLSKYPVNIIRLRRYLEDIVSGRLPQKVVLVESMDDIGAIERSMNAIIEQLSERMKEMEAEMEARRQAERLKDDFVSTVSHELRTPLAIAKEGISLLLDRIPGDINEKQGKVLKAARDNIDRLARLINDLLDISKIEAGKMQLRRGRMDMSQLVSHAASSLRPLAVQRGLTIEVRADRGPVEAYADEDRIMQVLTNLVGNAIKFTRQGGITVSVSSTDHEIECSVSDTGVGIAEEDMPKLFDKFTQFGRAHGAGEKGTGLGLAIVKSIVELHGGRVRAGSKLGVGSTFTFVIPRHSEDLVLRSRIDERIAEARRAQAPFSVFLFHLAFDEAGGDAESVRRTVRQGLLRLLQSKALARDTDVVHQRGDRELALVADSGPEHAASIVGRWMQEIEGCFSGDGTGGPVVRASCGFACYPRDGGSVEALLVAAEGSMRSGPDAARPEGGSAAPAPRS